MRSLGSALGIGLVLLGALWLLQEYNFIPGEFLYDLVSWPHRGAIAMAAGILILALSFLNPEKRP
jgi:hypothetical protein